MGAGWLVRGMGTTVYTMQVTLPLCRKTFLRVAGTQWWVPGPSQAFTCTWCGGASCMEYAVCWVHVVALHILQTGAWHQLPGDDADARRGL